LLTFLSTLIYEVIMSGLFSVAGTSRLHGIVKIRFANNIFARTKILDRGGHTEINLVEFKERLDKIEISRRLLEHPAFQDEESQTAILRYVAQNAPKEYDAIRKVTTPSREAITI